MAEVPFFWFGYVLGELTLVTKPKPSTEIRISDKMTIDLIGVTKIDKSMSVTLQWCGNTRNTVAVEVAYSCASKKNTERNKISFNKPFESTFAIFLTK